MLTLIKRHHCASMQYKFLPYLIHQGKKHLIYEPRKNFLLSQDSFIFVLYLFNNNFCFKACLSTCTVIVQKFSKRLRWSPLLVKVFSYEYCEIFKKSFFIEHH